MEIITLNGNWQLTRRDTSATFPATVPGCVHTALMAAGELDDPFYRDNEGQQMWIGETDWRYQRTFTVSDDLLARDYVLLRCHGIDTLATITLNGTDIARTDNMYRTYEFDIKAHLQAGENTLTIDIDAPLPYLRQRDADDGELYAWGVGAERLHSGAYLRKMPSNFGWDWGPQLVTSGIWRDIELVAYDTARLDGVLITQDHSETGVQLTVAVTSIDDSDLQAQVTLLLNDETIATPDVLTLDLPTGTVTIDVPEPQLWFPYGMGKGKRQLYTVQVVLSASDGTELDRVQKRIGLRTLELVVEADEWGESFHFTCNGVPFFAKGANWIPADVFPSRLTRADYDDLLQSVTAANMNMLRVWGGGIYESDDFYELCDEYGITVWQDFMFACATYPAYDEDFMATVRVEAEDNVRRLRHHACIALWCGNNEIEQGLVGPDKTWTATSMGWADYRKLFDDLLWSVVRDHAPQASYLPGSPHKTSGDRNDWANPDNGDVHLWGVWHGKEPFEWYRTQDHRFVSEFGFQSFPEPDTVYGFTEPDDRDIDSDIMTYHQRSGIGNSTIMHYLQEWFRVPNSFESTLWLSQILQGLAMKYAVEHWRRNMPRTMGTLYWQLNDLWPAPSWSSIDVHGRWKALHYMARRFYSSLLISGVDRQEDDAVEIHITSDLADERRVTVRWTITDLQGGILNETQRHLNAPAQGNSKKFTLHLEQFVQAVGGREKLILWLELLLDNGWLISYKTGTLAKPKEIDLPTPTFDIQIDDAGDHNFDIQIETDNPAFFIWFDLPGVRFSDNFFDLPPERPQRIRAMTDGMSLEDFREQLVVRSLVDTYQ